MKLLFNIQDKETSSDEIKAHLGYVDADLSFKNLMPDIITSTNDVKKIIGKEVYDLIHKHAHPYHSYLQLHPHHE